MKPLPPGGRIERRALRLRELSKEGGSSFRISALEVQGAVELHHPLAALLQLRKADAVLSSLRLVPAGGEVISRCLPCWPWGKARRGVQQALFVAADSFQCLFPVALARLIPGLAVLDFRVHRLLGIQLTPGHPDGLLSDGVYERLVVRAAAELVAGDRVDEVLERRIAAVVGVSSQRLEDRLGPLCRLARQGGTQHGSGDNLLPLGAQRLPEHVLLAGFQDVDVALVFDLAVGRGGEVDALELCGRLARHGVVKELLAVSDKLRCSLVPDLLELWRRVLLKARAGRADPVLLGQLSGVLRLDLDQLSEALIRSGVVNRAGVLGDESRQAKCGLICRQP